MSTDSVFYWGSGSPPCMRAMITIYEKELAHKFTMKLCSFEKREHRSPEVLSINPRGQVPTMKIDGVCINESSAICDYLEMQYKNQGTKLIPEDKTLCAQVLQRKAEVEATFGSETGNIFRYIYAASEEQKQTQSFKDEFQKKLEKFKNELLVWEVYLKGNKGYLVGSQFTMADVQFISHLMFFVRFGLDTSKFPNIAAYYNHIIQRDSIQKSWPPHWKEGENKKAFLQNM